MNSFFSIILCNLGEACSEIDSRRHASFHLRAALPLCYMKLINHLRANIRIINFIFPHHLKDIFHFTPTSSSR